MPSRPVAILMISSFHHCHHHCHSLLQECWQSGGTHALQLQLFLVRESVGQRWCAGNANLACLIVQSIQSALNSCAIFCNVVAAVDKLLSQQWWSLCSMQTQSASWHACSINFAEGLQPACQKSMPVFTMSLVGPCNQLVASSGITSLVCLLCAHHEQHVSFGRGARHSSLHSDCRHKSCEGSCH